MGVPFKISNYFSVFTNSLARPRNTEVHDGHMELTYDSVTPNKNKNILFNNLLIFINL